MIEIHLMLSPPLPAFQASLIIGDREYYLESSGYNDRYGIETHEQFILRWIANATKHGISLRLETMAAAAFTDIQNRDDQWTCWSSAKVNRMREGGL